MVFDGLYIYMYISDRMPDKESGRMSEYVLKNMYININTYVSDGI